MSVSRLQTKNELCRHNYSSVRKAQIKRIWISAFAVSCVFLYSFIMDYIMLYIPLQVTTITWYKSNTKANFSLL